MFFSANHLFPSFPQIPIQIPGLVFDLFVHQGIPARPSHVVHLGRFKSPSSLGRLASSQARQVPQLLGPLQSRSAGCDGAEMECRVQQNTHLPGGGLHGGTPGTSSIYRWIFPYKPSIFECTHLWKPHVGVRLGMLHPHVTTHARSHGHS